jgi:hypothetical protein
VLGTQPPSVGYLQNQIATTQWVNNLISSITGYATLAGNNQFTGINTFYNTTLFNGEVFVDNDITLSGTNNTITQTDITTNTNFNQLRGTNIYGDLILNRPTTGNGGAIRFYDVGSTDLTNFSQIFQSGTYFGLTNYRSTGAVGIYCTNSGSTLSQVLRVSAVSGVNIQTSTANNPNIILNVIETDSNQSISFYPNASSGTYNPFVLAGDNEIVAYRPPNDVTSLNTQTLVVGVHANNCNGLKVTPTYTTIGFGGIGGVPTNSFSCNAINSIIKGPAQFLNQALFTTSAQFNANIVVESPGVGGQSSNISQTDNGLTIINVNSNNFINLTTKTSAGTPIIGVSCADGFSAYLQGSSGNLLTISGSNPPTISIQPLSTSNTSEIATTAWVNTFTSTALAPYALLASSNTFTGTNTFQQEVIWSSTTSTNTGALLISGGGSYNGINDIGFFSVIGYGPTINTGTLTLTTWAGGYCGIKITNDTITQNAPFTCGYLTIPTPITTKSNNQIGYQWTVPGSSFNDWTISGPSYTAYPGNVYTMAWDGTGDKTLGVWQVNISLITSVSVVMDSSTICWTNNNGLPNGYYIVGPWLVNDNNNTAFDQQSLQLSLVMNITNLTQTYFLNFFRINGVITSRDTAHSQILFTRIA